MNHEKRKDLDVRDPVCGMTVSTESEFQLERAGALFRFCSRGCRHTFSAAPENFIEALDPVCGMSVDRSTTEHMSKHAGERFYFCSGRCRDAFDAAPDAYLHGKPTPEPTPAATIYTCPMHPQVEQVGPGDCPICGMALEPKDVPSADDGPNPELVDFTRRFWVGAALTVPVVLLAMGGYVGMPIRS